MASFRAEVKTRIKNQVGDGRVICGLSGGVDSSVVAVLLNEAIGEQLTCIFVDHGFMRLNEANDVVSMFRDHFSISLVHRDASDLFLGQLEDVIDPEIKRKIIGGLFVDVFEDFAPFILSLSQTSNQYSIDWPGERLISSRFHV